MIGPDSIYQNTGICRCFGFSLINFQVLPSRVEGVEAAKAVSGVGACSWVEQPVPAMEEDRWMDRTAVVLEMELRMMSGAFLSVGGYTDLKAGAGRVLLPSKKPFSSGYIHTHRLPWDTCKEWHPKQ